MTKFSKGDKIVFNQSVFLDGVLPDTTGFIGKVISDDRFVAIGDEWGENKGDELNYRDEWVDIEKSNQLNNKQ